MDRITATDSELEIKELLQVDIQHFLKKWSHLSIGTRIMMNDALVVPLRRLI